MRKIVLKIVIALSLISLAIGVSYYFKHYINKPADSYGYITITIKDISNKEETRTVAFNEGDMLIDILIREYKIRYENGSYGAILYDIEWIETDFYTTYIAIYIDNSYATKGCSYIAPIDGMTIQLVETKL